MNADLPTSPESNRKPLVPFRLIIGIVPLIPTLILFALARHTVLFPPNRIMPLFTPQVLRNLIAAGLLVPGAVCVLAACQRIVFGRPAWHDIVATLTPLWLLLLYPLRVFVLFPAGMPDAFGVLMTPRPLLWLSFSLCAFEFIRTAMRSPGVEKRLLSKLRDRSPAFVARLLFAGTLAVFVAVNFQNNRATMLVGDEPHYLFIMQSIKQFRTAELTQLLNVPEQDLPPGIVRVRPHKSRQSIEGRTHSIHNVGLPLLLTVPHALAGLHGVMFFFSIVTSLLVANMFLLGMEVTGRKWLSALTAVLLGFSCPFGFYFRCIYPDVVAGLMLIYAFRVLRARSPHALMLIAAGVAAAYLPWLHAKYVLFSATLFLGALGVLRRRPAGFAAFALPFLVSAPLLIWFFHTAYGSWLPNAQYGADSPPVSRFFWRGAPGLLFDRNHGLLAFAPLYFLVPAGMAAFAGNHRRDFASILVLTLPSFVTFASHWMWWGGPCPPGRFIIPLLPFALPPLVLAFGRIRSPACRLCAAAAAAVGIGLFLLSILFPDVLTTHKHIFSYCSRAWNTFPTLPSFFVHRRNPVPASSYALLACWLLPVALLTIHGMLRRNAGTPACRVPSVAIPALCIAIPGICAVIAANLGELQPVALFNFRLGEYVQPLIRSGIDPARFGTPDGFTGFQVLIPQKDPVLLSMSESDPIQGRSVETDFMDILYPVRYTFVCPVTATHTNDGPVGSITLLTHKGEAISTAEVSPERPESAGGVLMQFSPQAILPETRIRYTVLAPGSLEFGPVRLSALTGVGYHQ